MDWSAGQGPFTPSVSSLLHRMLTWIGIAVIIAWTACVCVSYRDARLEDPEGAQCRVYRAEVSADVSGPLS